MLMLEKTGTRVPKVPDTFILCRKSKLLNKICSCRQQSTLLLRHITISQYLCLQNQRNAVWNKDKQNGRFSNTYYSRKVAVYVLVSLARYKTQIERNNRARYLDWPSDRNAIASCGWKLQLVWQHGNYAIFGKSFNDCCEQRGRCK